MGEFQFQTGSIKSFISVVAGCGTTCKSFNSKLVRLKVDQHLITWIFMLCFNSKLVRLKGGQMNIKAVAKATFQFQTGSIKSTAASNSYQMSISFQFQTGSIKRIRKGIQRMIPLFSFNSKLVRLKVKVFIVSFLFLVCFNSKLVRLKGTSRNSKQHI